MAVNHYKTHGLFDHIVGGFDARSGNELEALPESPGDYSLARLSEG
jgi:hypothetical protein